MTKPTPSEERDVEKEVDRDYLVKTLRRAADALEKGESFRLQVAGERLTIPADAHISIEHERGDEDGEMTEEVEFQFRWNP